MIKIKSHIFYLAAFMCATILAGAQSFEVENRDVLLKIDLRRLNDTCIVLHGFLLNKTKEAIYFPPQGRGDTLMLDYNSGYDSTLIVQIGFFAPGKYSETVVHLIKLGNTDTIKWQNVYRYKELAMKRKVILTVDYLTTANLTSQVMDEFYNSILKNPLTNQEIYIMGGARYGKSCDWLTIKSGNIW